MRRVAFGLGANLGDAARTLRTAVAQLAAQVDLVAVSPLYRTSPVGGPAQPDYLNAVVVADSDREPLALLRLARGIEDGQGRVRLQRWGPRTLDVDLLAVDGIVLDTPELTLPHPRAHERGFVLVPWAQIDPQFEVPGRGRVADLADGLPAGGASVVGVPGDDWWLATERVQP